MKLSANLGFLWPDLGLLDRIDAAARAGFRAVELHWPYDLPAQTIRQAADRAGVVVLALNSDRGDVAGGENGLACLPGREAEFLASVVQARDYALILGARAVHVMSGRPKDPPEVWRALWIANMARAADLLAPLTLLIEPLNHHDAPGYAFATLPEAEALAAEVGRPNLALMFDAYHVAREGFDPATEWLRLRPKVGHIQIAGIPSRHEPDLTAPPLAAFIATLKAQGYDGWIGAEYRPQGPTDAGLGWRDAL